MVHQLAEESDQIYYKGVSYSGQLHDGQRECASHDTLEREVICCHMYQASELLHTTYNWL